MPDRNAAQPQPSAWLSQSAWTDYERCPRRYWHAYSDQTTPDRPAWRGWRFGRAVHAALEAAFRHIQGTKRTTRDASSVEAAREALGRAAVEEVLDRTRLVEADGMVRRSLRACGIRGTQVLDVEAWLRGQTPHGTSVTGRADLVLQHDDGCLDVRDHKVSRHPSTPSELAGDRQLTLYAWMAHQRWPEADRIDVSHHYPPLPRTVRAPLDTARMGEVIARLDAVAARIADDHAFAPTPGAHCRTCQWVRQCPAAPEQA